MIKVSDNINMFNFKLELQLELRRTRIVSIEQFKEAIQNTHRPNCQPNIE